MRFVLGWVEVSSRHEFTTNHINRQITLSRLPVVGAFKQPAVPVAVEGDYAANTAVVAVGAPKINIAYPTLQGIDAKVAALLAGLDDYLDASLGDPKTFNVGGRMGFGGFMPSVGCLSDGSLILLSTLLLDRACYTGQGPAHRYVRHVQGIGLDAVRGPARQAVRHRDCACAGGVGSVCGCHLSGLLFPSC